VRGALDEHPRPVIGGHDAQSSLQQHDNRDFFERCLKVGRVVVDLVEEVLDVRRGVNKVVLVELEVAVSSVQRPAVARHRVAQPCAGEPGPVWSVLGPPRGAALEDGGGAVGDVHLETDLVSGVSGCCSGLVQLVEGRGSRHGYPVGSTAVTDPAVEGEQEPALTRCRRHDHRSLSPASCSSTTVCTS
jgi:hypothetical protein